MNLEATRSGMATLLVFSLLILILAGVATGVARASQSGAVPSPGQGMHPAVAGTVSLANTWKNITSVIHPSARFGSSMTYDAADGYVVLFGGDNASDDSHGLNDTWIYSAGKWAQIFPSVSPSPREFASMSYDGADHYVVLFGGYSTITNGLGTYFTTVYSDTWKFSNGTWTQLSPTTSPPACIYAESVFDAHDGYLVLAESWCGYTWEYHHGTWTNLTSAAVPAGYGSALAYDARDGYPVYFKGSFGARVYTLTNGSWTQLPALPLTFTSRDYPVMAFDNKRGGVLLFGGITVKLGTTGADTPVYNDTWRFAAGTWHQIVTANAPPGRYFTSMVYDGKDGKLVLFGGVGDNPGLYRGTPAEIFSDTWVIS